MTALSQKFQVISLTKQYKLLLAWFISGLVLAILLSFTTSVQKPATTFNPSNVTSPSQPSAIDFAGSHLEPNFYQ